MLQNGTNGPIGDSTLAGKQVRYVSSFLVEFGQTSRGAWTISQSRRAQDAQLHLLFAKGKRPDRLALAEFAARWPTIAVSHDPLAAEEPAPESLWPGQQHWIELLCDGLTFDIAGLAPGPESAFPQIEHRFDCPEVPSSQDYEVVTLRAGPHLAAGGNAMPLMRTLLGLACRMVRHFDDLAALSWAPARSVIGRRFFESVTSAWLEGGPFPALGLTAFVDTGDGALESTGLAFWIGRELRIEPPLGSDRVAATRLGIRLVNHLVLAGEPAADERIIAPDGSPLVLRAARERALISVWRE